MYSVSLSLIVLGSIFCQVHSWYLLKKDVTSACTREGRRSSPDGLHACLAALNDAAQNLRTPLITRSRRLSIYIDVIFDAAPTIFNVCCDSHASGGRIVTINPLDTESRTDALETREQPFINLEKIGVESPDELFTLMLVKSSYDDRYLGIPHKPLILWLVSDIQRDSITNGHVKIPYMGPACTEKDNTYMFLLYRQNGPVPLDTQSFSDPGACPEMNKNAFRCQFDVNRFTREAGMQLAGASWFHCVHSTYSVYKMIHDMDIPEADACLNSPLSAATIVDGQLRCSQGNGFSDFLKNPLRFGNIPKTAPPSDDSEASPQGEMKGIPKKISDFLSYIFDLNDDYTPDDKSTIPDNLPPIELPNGPIPVDSEGFPFVEENGTYTGGVIDDMMPGDRDGNDSISAQTTAQTNDLAKAAVDGGQIFGKIFGGVVDQLPVAGESVVKENDVLPPLGKVVAEGGEIAGVGPPLGSLSASFVDDGPGDAPSEPSVTSTFIDDGFVVDPIPPEGETIATRRENIPDIAPPFGKTFATGSIVDGPFDSEASMLPLAKTVPDFESIKAGEEYASNKLPPAGKVVASGSVVDEPFNSASSILPPANSEPKVGELLPPIIKEITGGEIGADTTPEFTKLLFKSENSDNDQYTQNTPGTTTAESDVVNAVPRSVDSQPLVDLPRFIDLNPPSEATKPADVTPSVDIQPTVDLRPPPLPQETPSPDPVPVFRPQPQLPLDVAFLEDGHSQPDDPPRFSNNLVGDTGIADDDRMIDLKGLFDQLLRQSNVPPPVPPVDERPFPSPLARILFPGARMMRPSFSPYRSRLSDYFRVLGFPFEERSPADFPFFNEEVRETPAVYSKLSISRFPGYSNVLQSMETDDGVESISYVESPAVNNDAEIVTNVFGTVHDGILEGEPPKEPQPIPQGLFPNPLSIDISDQISRAQDSVPVESPLDRLIRVFNDGETSIVIEDRNE